MLYGRWYVLAANINSRASENGFRTFLICLNSFSKGGKSSHHILPHLNLIYHCQFFAHRKLVVDHLLHHEYKTNVKEMTEMSFT